MRSPARRILLIATRCLDQLPAARVIGGVESLLAEGGAFGRLELP